MFDREQADFVCDYLECLTCSSGVPLRLIDWQRDMVQAFYGEMTEDEDAPGEYLRKYQYLYLEIPKKNGKSEISAGLGTYHLFADGESSWSSTRPRSKSAAASSTAKRPFSTR